jgi:hypothetical protein
VMLQRVRTRIALVALTLTAIVAPSVSAQTAQGKAQNGARHTAADVQFMQGMIGHHGQAVVMAAMAPTHGASAQVSLFCRKILSSQRDEIELMQNWLRERGERVPDPNDAHAGMEMAMDMDMSTAASTALSSAADVYQAGLTLYRMSVGLGHFDYQLHLAKQALGPKWPAAVVAGQFPSRHHYPAHIPNRLRGLIMKALEPNPADRFNSILEMQNELAKVDEYLDWQFDPSVPGTHQWHLVDGTYERTVMDEPDGGALRKISVRRTNLVTGVTNNLGSLGAAGLSVAKAASTAQAAFVSQSATTP